MVGLRLELNLLREQHLDDFLFKAAPVGGILSSNSSAKKLRVLVGLAAIYTDRFVQVSAGSVTSSGWRQDQWLLISNRRSLYAMNDPVNNTTTTRK